MSKEEDWKEIILERGSNAGKLHHKQPESNLQAPQLFEGFVYSVDIARELFSLHHLHSVDASLK